MENKAKKMMILLGVIVIIAVIIAVAAYQGKKKVATPGIGTQTNQPAGNPATETNPETATSTEIASPVNEILKDATVAAPGANPVTKDNKVVTQEGKQTQNDVAQTSPLAPAETGPVSKDSLAAGVIQLEVNGSGFTPKEFTIKPGAPVSISITATDAFAHSFVFEDPALSAIGIGVYGVSATNPKGETRVITFNAPTQAGEYVFYCNVGSHRSRGEEGKMIVK